MFRALGLIIKETRYSHSSNPDRVAKPLRFFYYKRKKAPQQCGFKEI